MEASIKRKIFRLLAENFETEEMKNYYLDMAEKIPDYFFTMPSSTSGKYHNKTQCQPFGQLYHIFMFDSVVNHRLRLKGNQEKFSDPMVRDCMRATAGLHDAIKCGWNGSTHTVPEHPMLAAEFVRKTHVEHDIPPEYKEIIAGMCEAHSGQWNTNRKKEVIMPEPRNDMEFFIHECDILSSRNDIDMVIPEALSNVVKDVEYSAVSIEAFKLPFGKHKGKTLLEIKAEAPDYIDWMKTQSMRAPIPALLKMLEETG